MSFKPGNKLSSWQTRTNPLADVDPGPYKIRAFVDAGDLQSGDDLPQGVYVTDSTNPTQVGARVTGRPRSVGSGLIEVPIGNRILTIESDLQVLVHRDRHAKLK